MAKGVPKTMRFEKDVEDYINSFDGGNFSEKFHNLVRYFQNTEKEMKEKIKALDNAIKEREKRLQDLNSKLSNVSWLESSFRKLNDDIERLKNGIINCDKAIKDVIQN
ncbi:MAG TPA: hypothetical protein PLF27_07190 [Sedimentibacter sp.]|nr:hypothetical protein [Sedimentibacter sp.]